MPRRKRRDENGLCADPLAKSRFYRLAAVLLFIFRIAKASVVFRGKKYIICGICGGQFKFNFYRRLSERVIWHVYGGLFDFGFLPPRHQNGVICGIYMGQLTSLRSGSKLRLNTPKHLPFLSHTLKSSKSIYFRS